MRDIICGRVVMFYGIFMPFLNFSLSCILLQIQHPFDVHNLPWIGTSFVAVMLSGLCVVVLFHFLWDFLLQWIIMMLIVAAIMLLVCKTIFPLKHQQDALCLSLALTCWPFLWLLQVTACCIAYVSATLPNGVTFNAHMMAELMSCWCSRFVCFMIIFSFPWSPNSNRLQRNQSAQYIPTYAASKQTLVRFFIKNHESLDFNENKCSQRRWRPALPFE